MEQQLANQVVIITGASAGIGRATAVALAQAGADVVLVARRPEPLHAVAEALAPYPGRCLVVPGDVGDAAFAPELIAQTVATFGRLDVLINNAGIGHRSRLAEMPPADMRRLLDTNVLGPLYLVQAAVPQMKRQGAGHIINVSSVVGQMPLPGMGLYCASKTAVNFISRTLGHELHRDNIRVTAVYPGRTATEFGQKLLGQKRTNPSAIGRVPPPHVARAILKAIRSRKRHVYVTWYDALAAHLARLFPGLTDWLIRRAHRR